MSTFRSVRYFSALTRARASVILTFICVAFSDRYLPRLNVLFSVYSRHLWGKFYPKRIFPQKKDRRVNMSYSSLGPDFHFFRHQLNAEAECSKCIFGRGSAPLSTWVGNQPPRATQPPILHGTAHEHQPKCDDALRLGSKCRLPYNCSETDYTFARIRPQQDSALYPDVSFTLRPL